MVTIYTWKKLSTHTVWVQKIMVGYRFCIWIVISITHVVDILLCLICLSYCIKFVKTCKSKMNIIYLYKWRFSLVLYFKHMMQYIFLWKLLTIIAKLIQVVCETKMFSLKWVWKQIQKCVKLTLCVLCVIFQGIQ